MLTEQGRAVLAALSVRLVGNDVVLVGATGSVGRLDGKLDTALANGELKHFNRKYRRRRIAAKVRFSGADRKTYAKRREIGKE